MHAALSYNMQSMLNMTSDQNIRQDISKGTHKRYNLAVLNECASAWVCMQVSLLRLVYLDMYT